ncbi:MAG: hydroxyethylthiazole kinase [Peptostreptococcus sp.]|uniref:hydroxyethylthiazole kinase n=1 Tax=Peptostreptococcus sp. TaxID=1262 RepID=UPI002FCC52B9
MDIERIKKEVCEAIDKVRSKKPLIEQITNYVTINDCANVTLSIGASPVMADGEKEVEEMTSIADALVLNFGIIDVQPLETIVKAGVTANKKNIPVVFDPVGMGSIKYRSEAVLELLEKVHMDVIKGNASEIMSLAGVKTKTKGVDSNEDSLEAIDSAVKIANKYRCVCAVTGSVDIITDGRSVVKIYNESDILSYITGTGCMIASLIASFLGAGASPLISAIAGVLAMSISGELAIKREEIEKNGIGTYRVDVMNNIYHFSPEIVKRNAKIDLEKREYKYSMYLITDEASCLGKDLYKSVEESIKGGANLVQLREKNVSTREFFERAVKLKEICHKHNVPLIINDRIDIALAIDADGVHLGQSDMPIELAKKIIGHQKIVGISAGNMKEAISAQESGADYIGVGAVFNTDTKKDADYVSKELLCEMTSNLHIPVLAIGGIKLDNLDYLRATDIEGICVISDILKNTDCKKRTEDLIGKFRNEI